MNAQPSLASTQADTSALQFLLGMDTQLFQKEFYRKKPLLMKGDPERYSELFSWRALTKLLNVGETPVHNLKLNLEGRFLPTDSHRDVQVGLKQGATLIVDNVDRHWTPLGEFLDRITTETATPTRFNMYASPQGKQGYKIHYDTHDVFILQVEGKKDWFVFPPTIEQPLYYQKRHSVIPPSTDKLELKCTLQKGDLLYIPKGHWHYAVATAEPSLHLTLGFFARTGIDLLLWIVDELRDDVQVRRELPWRWSEASLDGLASEESGAVEPIATAVAALLADPGLADRFRRYSLASTKNRQPFNLPVQLGSAESEKAATSFYRYPHPYSIDNSNGQDATLMVCGKSYNLSNAAAGAVAVIFGSTTFTREEVLAAAPQLDWATLWPLLEELMKDGVIYSVK